MAPTSPRSTAAPWPRPARRAPLPAASLRSLDRCRACRPGSSAKAYPDEPTESAAYRELADTLATAGVDLLLVEMMQETRHAPLALAAAKTTGLPVWLGVSCRLGSGGALVGFDFPLLRLDACLDALLPLAPDAVAVMHSPPAALVPALGTLRQRFAGPLGAYPEIGDGTAPDALTPEELAAAALSWLTGGAQIIGGCCGTTPAHIRALHAMLAARGARRGKAAPSATVS